MSNSSNGISVAAIVDFAQRNVNEIIQKDTFWVCDNLIKSESVNVSFVDHLMKGPMKIWVDKPNLFVSHAWQGQFKDLKEAITDWCTENKLDINRTFVWIDIFCVNQHDDVSAGSDIAEVYRMNITRFGSAIIVLDSWRDPMFWSTRLWCIFEYAMIRECGIKFSFTISPEARAALTKFLLDDGSLEEFIIKVDVDTCKVSKPKDHKDLQSAMELNLGAPSHIKSALLKEACEVSLRDFRITLAQQALAKLEAEVGAGEAAALPGPLPLVQYQLTAALRSVGVRVIPQLPALSALHLHLAMALKSAGRFEESAKMLQKRMDVQNAVLGKDAREKAETADMLGNVYCCLGNFQLALAMFKSVKDSLEALGEAGLDMAKALCDAGYACRRTAQGSNAAKKRDEALDLYTRALRLQKALEARRRLMRASRLEANVEECQLAMVTTLLGAAAVFSDQSRLKEALACYKEARDLLTRCGGAEEGHPSHAAILTGSAAAYSRQGEHATAILQLDGLIKDAQQKRDRHSSRATVAQLGLAYIARGRAIMAQGKKEAPTALLDFLKAKHEVEPWVPKAAAPGDACGLAYADALAGFAEANRAQGAPDRKLADQWEAAVEARRAAAFAPTTDVSLADALLNLARAQKGVGTAVQVKKSKDNLTEARGIYQAALGPDDPKTKNADAGLAQYAKP